MTWTISIHDCLMVLFTFIRSPSTHMRASFSIMDKHIMDMAPIKEVEAKMGAGLDKSYGREEKQGVEEEEEEVVVLPGFRFHPTDEELVAFYLRRKVAKKTLSIEIIKEIDIYKYSPWDLPKVSTASEKEMYFFCLRGRKYRNSIRPNRVTGSGFWKATGIDRPIYSSTDASECVGLKKSLVYYRGSAGKGTKTEWMMHEFRLPSTTKNNVSSSINSPSTQEAEIWTICRILKRNVTYKKHVQTWKNSANYKQIPADSTSNTGSFESDARDEYKCFTNIQHGESLARGFNFGGTNQLYASQWNPAVQSPLSALYPQIQNPVANEFCKEGNWDELGRIMECVIDPAFNYGYSSYL